MPHAPGPPGTLHDAQGLSAAIRPPPDEGTLTAKVESSFSSCSLLHFGHEGVTPARVRCSNLLPHDPH